MYPFLKDGGILARVFVLISLGVLKCRIGAIISGGISRGNNKHGSIQVDTKRDI
jgi:hypothetical protein